jgi:hypothetical protein
LPASFERKGERKKHEPETHTSEPDDGRKLLLPHGLTEDQARHSKVGQIGKFLGQKFSSPSCKSYHRPPPRGGRSAGAVPLRFPRELEMFACQCGSLRSARQRSCEAEIATRVSGNGHWFGRRLANVVERDV